MQKMSSKRRREIAQTAGFVFVRHESPSNLPSAGAFYNGCQILLTINNTGSGNQNVRTIFWHFIQFDIVV